MTTFINPLTGHDTPRAQVVLGPYQRFSDHLVGAYTFVCKFGQPLIGATGTKIRLTLQGTNHPTSNLTGTINNVTISTASSATGAKAYDSTTTPTAVTFGGSASVSISRGSIHRSDEISFEVTGQRPLLIAFNTAASAHVVYSAIGAPLHSSLYYKVTVQEADDATRGTGYSVFANTAPYIRTLEVFS